LQGRQSVVSECGRGADIGGTHVSAARVDSMTGSVDSHVVRGVAEPMPIDILLECILGAASSVGAVDAVGCRCQDRLRTHLHDPRRRGASETLYGVDLRSELGALSVLADGSPP
jgi:hypothetical protein